MGRLLCWLGLHRWMCNFSPYPGEPFVKFSCDRCGRVRGPR